MMISPTNDKLLATLGDSLALFKQAEADLATAKINLKNAELALEAARQNFNGALSSLKADLELAK